MQLTGRPSKLKLHAMKNASHTIANGFPSTKNMLSPELYVYWPMREEIYTIDGGPFKKQKMLIPKSSVTSRPLVLEGLHAAHQGTAACWRTLAKGSSGQDSMLQSDFTEPSAANATNRPHPNERSLRSNQRLRRRRLNRSPLTYARLPDSTTSYTSMFTQVDLKLPISPAKTPTQSPRQC